MGRELRRVPLDFDWAIGRIWDGFLNPFYIHAKDCEHCSGTGNSPTAIRLKDQWYGNQPFVPSERGSTPFSVDHPIIRKQAWRNVTRAPGIYGACERAVLAESRRLAAHFNRGWSHHLNADDVAALVKANRLHDLTHTFVPGEGWKPKEPAYTPTPAEVNEWSLQGFGHDSINQWIVVGAECERLGIASTCEHCQGEGSIWNPPEAKQQADTWERSGPPSGDGYQMWETTTEGSPISPVFATAEQLADWLVCNRNDTIDEGTTREQWLKFITGPGWAPTMITDASGVRFGAQAV